MSNPEIFPSSNLSTEEEDEYVNMYYTSWYAILFFPAILGGLALLIKYLQKISFE